MKAFKVLSIALLISFFFTAVNAQPRHRLHYKKHHVMKHLNRRKN